MTGAELKKVLDFPIESLNLSLRATNSIRNITGKRNLNIRDIIQITKKKYLRSRNCGIRKLQEINEKLKPLGLAIDDNVLDLEIGSEGWFELWHTKGGA